MENNLLDKGWSAMREMLDREMPTQRNHTWLLLLLLPILGTAIGFAWRQHNRITANQTTATNTARANIAQDQGADIAPMVNLPKSTPPQQLNSAKANKPIHAKIFESEDALQETDIVKKTDVIATEQTVFGDTETQQKQASKNHNRPSVVSSIDTPYPQPIITPQNSQSIEAIKPIEPIHFIEGAGWKFGASNVIFSERFNTVNGFAAGAVADWHISPKWGLRLGLQYGIYSPRTERRPVASVLSSSYINRTANGLVVFDGNTKKEWEGVSNSELYDSLGNLVLIPLKRVQQLELPLLAFWKPRPYLKLLGGIHFARILSTRADAENYSGEYVLRLSDEEAESNASQLSTAGMNKWAVEASAGAGVRVNKMFDVGIMARVPLAKTEVIASYDLGNSTNFDADMLKQKRNMFMLTVYGILFF